jgi:hypothetical protein
MGARVVRACKAVVPCWCVGLQVTGTLLKGYKARFKGAPISSTVNYLKQYVSVSHDHGCLSMIR